MFLNFITFTYLLPYFFSTLTVSSSSKCLFGTQGDDDDRRSSQLEKEDGFHIAGGTSDTHSPKQLNTPTNYQLRLSGDGDGGDDYDYHGWSNVMF